MRCDAIHREGESEACMYVCMYTQHNKHSPSVTQSSLLSSTHIKPMDGHISKLGVSVSVYVCVCLKSLSPGRAPLSSLAWRLLLRLLLLHDVIHVLKQIVGRQLLVLVAADVRLGGSMAREPESLQPLHRLVVLRRQLHRDHLRWLRSDGLLEYPHKLLRMLLDQRHELWVLHRDGLQDLIERLGLTLHECPQLVELGVVPQRSQRTALSLARLLLPSHGRRRLLLLLLLLPHCGRRRLLPPGTRHGCSGRHGRPSRGRGRSLRLCTARDPRHEVLDGSVRVVEGGAHGQLHLRPVETHVNDVLNRRFEILSSDECRCRLVIRRSSITTRTLSRARSLLLLLLGRLLRRLLGAGLSRRSLWCCWRGSRCCGGWRGAVGRWGSGGRGSSACSACCGRLGGGLTGRSRLLLAHDDECGVFLDLVVADLLVVGEDLAGADDLHDVGLHLRPHALYLVLERPYAVRRLHIHLLRILVLQRLHLQLHRYLPLTE
mmetsp:Transcript_8129/g.23076  ORF Transcript_8129/g.23076 Transcript_8129/m.23076 type:complete len:489 (-) Transcript_8129:83-1549(-)